MRDHVPVPRPPIDRDVLVELYVERGLSKAETAAVLEVSRTTVYRRMVQLGIPRRFQGPTRCPRHPYRAPGEILTRRYLRDVYQRQGATVNAIAAHTGINAITVRRFLDLHGIARRGRGHQIRMRVDRRQLARWYRSGVPAAEMADRLGCAKSTVYDLLRRFGFRSEYRPRVIHNIDRDRLGGLRAQGLSTDEIAYRLGCSKSTVQRALVRAGMPRHARAVKYIIDPAQLAVLRAEGWTLAAIAVHFGCSPSTVRRALAAAGISRRG